MTASRSQAEVAESSRVTARCIVFQNPDFVAVRWIIHQQLEHESVNLSFRKRIRPFVLDWVLSGNDEEWSIQSMSISIDADLLFLHYFQQSGLSLGGERLISSASRILVNTGPWLKVKFCSFIL